MYVTCTYTILFEYERNSLKESLHTYAGLAELIISQRFHKFVECQTCDRYTNHYTSSCRERRINSYQPMKSRINYSYVRLLGYHPTVYIYILCRCGSAADLLRARWFLRAHCLYNTVSLRIYCGSAAGPLILAGPLFIYTVSLRICCGPVDSCGPAADSQRNTI